MSTFESDDLFMLLYLYCNLTPCRFHIYTSIFESFIRLYPFQVVSGCNAHASTLENRWSTDLYLLTKQDVALREIRAIFDIARPIMYVTSFVPLIDCMYCGMELF